MVYLQPGKFWKGFKRLEFGDLGFSQKLQDPPLQRGHSKWLLVWFLRYDDI